MQSSSRFRLATGPVSARRRRLIKWSIAAAVLAMIVVPLVTTDDFGVFALNTAGLLFAGWFAIRCRQEWERGRRFWQNKSPQKEAPVAHASSRGFVVHGRSRTSRCSRRRADR